MPSSTLSVARFLRVTASIFLGLLVLIFLLYIAGSEVMIGSQVDQNERLQYHFQQADYYVRDALRRSGHLPTPREVQDWTTQMGFGGFNMDPAGCPIPYFRKNPGDQFVLSVRQGGRYQCYAAPSGKTTLLTADETRSVATIQSGVLLALALIFSLLAWGIYPRHKKVVQAASNS